MKKEINNLQISVIKKQKTKKKLYINLHTRRRLQIKSGGLQVRTYL